MNVKPDILYVCTHNPLGPQFGAQHRTLQILTLLERVGNVRLVLASLKTWDEQSLAKLHDRYNFVGRLPLVHAPRLSLLKRISRDLNKRNLNTHGIVAEQSTCDRLRELASQCDVTWFHTLRLANAFGYYRWPRSVIDLDDLLSQSEYARARHSEGWLKRANCLRGTLAWRRRESDVLNRFTAATVCSDADKAYLGGDDRIHVVANGFRNCQAIPSRDANLPPRLGFIGLLDYRPNMEGMEWFTREVWPRVRQEVPEALVRLVGKDSNTSSLLNRGGIEGLGYVEDPNAEMATWRGMIVPIRVGAGTRVKIAEAFSRRIPVVSTSLGAYGYPVKNEREMFLADDAETFARACIRVMTDSSLGQRLAGCAHAMFEKHYTWDAIGHHVSGVVQHVQSLESDVSARASCRRMT